MRRLFIAAAVTVVLGSAVFGAVNVANAQGTKVFEAGVKDGAWRDTRNVRFAGERKTAHFGIAV